MKEFYPVHSDWQHSVDRRTKNSVINLYCLDWDQDINIKGLGSSNENEKIEVIFAPCNYLHNSYGWVDRPVPADCVADFDKMKEYMGNIQLTVLYNDEEFDQSKYGHESIHRSSKLFIK
mmetsp:Transcript_2845/g.3879  ORF Transcript_2845/g.3879 Transcript_2845/m.3879 type:complete len:119 (+) Transcript_2845:131-487(+)